jgi:hypothetical protein
MSDLLIQAKQRLAAAQRAREHAERQAECNPWSGRHRQAAMVARRQELMRRQEVLREEAQRALPL